LQAAEALRHLDLTADLELLREAGREAGRIAMRYFRKTQEVWMKGGVSPVSEADYAVDKFLRETLLAARPDYGWLSEETADTAARLGARRTFVVDPIDGTRGFLEGGDRWCVCLAVVEAGVPIAGLLECPAREETFSALPGEGAFKNGERLTVRDPGPNPAIGGPKPLLDALPDRIKARARRVSHVPSLAYRLAMIADGALDATFVKANSHDWDLAAADLVLREAGGQLLDAHGAAPLYAGPEIRHGVLVAGSGGLLAAFSRIAAAQAA
jgi:myo-inositol-1(or 4)-monophosphatase